MLFTQSLGSVCFFITPSDSIRNNSVLTFSFIEIGTFLGGWMTGFTDGSTFIEYVSGMQPRPSKRSLYDCITNQCLVASLFVLATHLCEYYIVFESVLSFGMGNHQEQTAQMNRLHKNQFQNCYLVFCMATVLFQLVLIYVH